MISIDPEHLIREKIASEFEIKRLSDDRMVVYVPLVFDDGDQCSIYLSSADGDKWVLSDRGDVLKRASYSGVDLLNPGHEDRLRKLIGFYGVKEHEGELDMIVAQSDLADALFTFAQTCLEATWLAKLPKERALPATKSFRVKFGKLIEKALSGKEYARNWHDPNLDSNQLYSVDYRLATNDGQLLLFGIAGPSQCMRATIACQHYRMANATFKAVAVYDDEEKISSKYTQQLKEVADKTFPKVSQKKTIKSYLKNAICTNL